MLVKKLALFDDLHLVTLFKVKTKTDSFLTSLPQQKIELNLLISQKILKYFFEWTFSSTEL